MDNSLLYLQRLRTALQLEYESEKEDYRLQSERIGLERKIRRGICWYPISIGRSYYNSLNQPVIEVFNERKEEEEETFDTVFEYGKPVQFWVMKEERKLQYLPYNCQVSFVDNRRMVVILPSSQPVIELQNTEGLGIQLSFDETSYRTMFHAMEDVMKARGNRLATLREIFAGNIKPEKRSFAPMSFPWLNASQQSAVNEVLWAKDVQIVHGPPGTGKTTTLVEAIHETLNRETQVMVCAQSNMAVDWISEKLVDYGIPVLRIGNPSRVNDKMLSFTYERRYESHQDYPELWKIRRTIREIYEHRKKGESVHQKISRLRDRASEIEMRIHADLFNSARVIACTLVGAANKTLVGQKFSTLFIDEAAQAMEPACWIAIRRASRVVLAGDHQQLPPTIKCYDAQKAGLGITLMERIVKTLPGSVVRLETQYRMNDAIMQFPSRWFYDGKLKSATEVRGRGILDFDNPISWIDTSEIEPDSDNVELDFSEHFIGENHGRINKAEAKLLISVLEDYIGKIGIRHFLDERLDVGIITPYRVQAQYIRTLIRNNEALRTVKSSISVNTVDGFQGQERDIILISLVRSNDKGQIGFLNDLRRMNVAITRAKSKLVIIGNAATLSSHPFYKQLYDFINTKRNPS